jgi:hypothetical protein
MLDGFDRRVTSIYFKQKHTSVIIAIRVEDYNHYFSVFFCLLLISLKSVEVTMNEHLFVLAGDAHIVLRVSKCRKLQLRC